MKHHARLLILGWLLIAAASSAVAQGPDVRISFEPAQILLPEDAQVQSAARIDSLTLVVWGSTADSDYGPPRNVLYAQLIRGATRLKQPVMLDTAAGYPNGHVQVVEWGDRFLVFWSGFTSGGGEFVFVARVDTSGNEIGASERVGLGAIDSLGLTIIPLANGRLVLWNDTAEPGSARIRYRMFGSDGAFLGAAGGPLPGELTDAIPLGSPAGLWLIKRTGATPLLVRPDGSFNTLGTNASRKLSYPLVISTDGSIVTLDGDTLRFYRTVLDSVAYRSRYVPIPAGAHPGLRVVVFDSVGRVAVVYATGGTGHFDGGPSPQVSLIDFYRLSLNQDDTYASAVRIGGLYITTPSDSRISDDVSLRGSTRQNACGNRYNMSATFDLLEKRSRASLGLPDTTVLFDVTVDYSIDERGAIIPVPSMFAPYFAPECRQRPDLPVTRLRAATTSSVSVVVLGNQTVQLSAPASIRTENVAQRFPAITAFDNDVAAGWLSTNVDSAFWYGNVEVPLSGPPKNPAALTIRSILSGIADLPSHWSRDTLQQVGNTVYMAGDHHWTEKDAGGERCPAPSIRHLSADLDGLAVRLGD